MADQQHLSRVDEFVDRLASLPFATWAEIGAGVSGDRDLLARRATAHTLLDAILADRQLLVTAWYVRDAVDTAAFLASRTAITPKSAQRRLFAAAHGAAEAAALALLAADHLARADRDVLCEPFAEYLPGPTEGAFAFIRVHSRLD